MTTEWVRALAGYEREGVPCVIVTLISIQGSSPREPGAKMVVTAEASDGTLGGGTVELQAQEHARELLTAGEPGPRLEEFVLNDRIDQACGGRMSVLFEPVLPSSFAIAVFGAGHVGRALVRVLADVSCRVRWVDSRAGIFPATIPANVTVVVAENPAAEVAKLPAGALLLAMTHSHDADLEIVRAALGRADLRFVGTIGSKTKRGRFLHRLEEAGLGDAARERLVIPIGVSGAGGKHPAEIAIAVAAQLLQVRETACPDTSGASV